MVDITIFVEGGILKSENATIQTINNSEKLRESFYHLFSQICNNERFNIIVEMGASEKQAAKFFKMQNHASTNSLLVIDLDRPSNEKNKKLDYLDLKADKDKIIFMVQKMESWILSQPETIDKVFSARYKREKINFEIAADNKLIYKHPEEIKNPDKVLNIILQRYFSEIKRGKKKKKKYGKLKDAPVLLANLDTATLKEFFIDIRKLNNILNDD
jgi:hypothetical protein